MSSASTNPWRGLDPAAPRPRDLHVLYTRRQLEAVLHRERARADRNNSEFSLVLFRVRADEPRLVFRLARLLLRRSRAIDELGWFDETCVAALLPYTTADGARSFSEHILKDAQEQLIPALCRIYTYPSAWFFEGDGPRRADSGNGNGHTNGNGHANGDGHSHGSPDGHHHGNSHFAGHNGDHNGNGHHDEHPVHEGNGDSPAIAHLANGEGGVAVQEATTLDRRLARKRSVQVEAALAPSDLVPFVLQGVSDGLRPPDAGADGVETLLLRRLPWWKRTIDICGAVAGLVMLSPIMFIAAAAIRMSSAGPIIFKQRRAGLGGQPFWIYKFRTMIADAEARKASLRKESEQDGPAFKLKRDPRITPVGKFLRETSLDELPQLWNVLIGDMSLVGPRPLPMDESAACDRWQRRRLDVTPGLTCIWQVKGRSRVTFAEWMRMDVNYIRGRSLWRDVSILAETIPAVLMRRGAK